MFFLDRFRRQAVCFWKLQGTGQNKLVCLEACLEKLLPSLLEEMVWGCRVIFPAHESDDLALVPAGWRREGCVTVRPYLEMMRLELVFRFQDVGWLPPFRGSLWKGVLGPALKRLDQSGRWNPPVRLGIPRELYGWAFATSADSCLIAPENDGIPRPIIIDAPSQKDWEFVEPGQTLRFQVTLIGRFCVAWQAIVMAFADAGRRGIGRAITREGKRGRAALLSVHQVWRSGGRPELPLWNAEAGWLEKCPHAHHVAAPGAGMVRVNVASAMRIERNGRLIGPGQFGPRDLFAGLIRRTRALMASQGGMILDTDAGQLVRRAGAVPVSNIRIRRETRRRWSASQDREIPVPGLVGGFDLDLRGCEELFDFLWLAQWINVGKGAFMGAGSVRLRPL